MKTIRLEDKRINVPNDVYARLEAIKEKEGLSTIGEAYEHYSSGAKTSVSEVKESRLEKEDSSRREDRRLAPYVNHKEEDFKEACPVNARLWEPFMGVPFCSHHMRAKVTDRTIMANLVNPNRCGLCMQARRSQEAERQAKAEGKAQERELNIRGKAQVDMYSANHMEHFFTTPLSFYER